MSLIIFFFVLGLLIIVHEFGHFIAARRMGVKIEKFSLGFGPQIFSKRRKGIEYTLSAIPLGGYVKLAGDNLEEYKGEPFEYLAKPISKRFWIIFYGPFLNYILGFLCLWFIFFIGYPTLTTKVGGLINGFGAKDAGMQVGDKITAIDGKKVDFWEDLHKAMRQRKNKDSLKVSILRGEEVKVLEVSIKEKKMDDQLGQKRSVGLLGITPYDEIVKVRHGFFASFALGLRKTWGVTETTYKALWRMITGKLSVRESVTGPLGIFLITSKAASLGVIALIHLIAILSISLGIFNLLPLPVLDGGHILLLGIEKIRGRYLSLKAERLITQIGVTLIITLAVLVTYNDLNRLWGDKIAKFFAK